jgi:hypothetical protein
MWTATLMSALTAEWCRIMKEAPRSLRRTRLEKALEYLRSR